MTPEQIMQWFKNEGVCLAMYCNLGYVTPNWTLTAKKDSKNLKIEVSVTDISDFEGAVKKLYDRWLDIVHGGAPEFRGPLIDLTAEASVITPLSPDDDIPF